MVLVEVKQLGTGTRYGLEILYQSGKRIKNKSLKFFGANFYVCISYREKTGWGCFLPPPILNRVNIHFLSILSIYVSIYLLSIYLYIYIYNIYIYNIYIYNIYIYIYMYTYIYIYILLFKNLSMLPD